METEADFPLWMLIVRGKEGSLEWRRTFWKAWWSFEFSSDVVDGWWLSDDEECEDSVSVWLVWSR